MASRTLLPRLLATASLAGLLASSVPAFASGVPLLAHRAVYDLTLGKANGTGSTPSSARGRIVYEFSGSACEGYSTTFRQLTEIQMEEGNSRMSDMRSSTFEDGDGSAFQFRTETQVDGRLVDSIDGRARRSGDGAIAVDLTKPVQAKTDLSPGAVFPTAQIVEIVTAAKRGDRTAELKIFDGSDSGMKVFDTLSVIGREVTSVSAETAAASADALKGVRRWPVSISYFDPTKPDAGPNYVLGFDLYENGVSGGLKIDYGAYTLNGQMTKFEVLPQKGCAK